MPTSSNERDLYPVGYAYDSRCFDSPESQRTLDWFPDSICMPPFLPKPYWFILHYLLDNGGHILDRALEVRDRHRLEAMARNDMVVLNEGWWSLTIIGYCFLLPLAQRGYK